MRIEIELPRCEGHSQCEIAAPGYFKVGDDAKAHLVRPDVEPNDVDLLKATVLRCPTAAIRLVEE